MISPVSNLHPVPCRRGGCAGKVVSGGLRGTRATRPRRSPYVSRDFSRFEVKPRWGAAKLQTQQVRQLTKEKCAALKSMLNQERLLGTGQMAAINKAWLPGVGRAALFADPNSVASTPTSMGPMDLDWFITLNAGKYMLTQGGVSGAVANRLSKPLTVAGGWVGKWGWNLLHGVMGDKQWKETPYSGSESPALGAFLSDKKLSDLITPELLSQMCPD